MSGEKKDRKFLAFLCVTALVGLANILLNGVYGALLPYLLCTGLSVPALFFNYTLCRWGNRLQLWINGVHFEKDYTDREPSEDQLRISKIVLWTVFGAGLCISLATIFIG